MFWIYAQQVLILSIKILWWLVFISWKAIVILKISAAKTHLPLQTIWLVQIHWKYSRLFLMRCVVFAKAVPGLWPRNGLLTPKLLPPVNLCGCVIFLGNEVMLVAVQWQIHAAQRVEIGMRLLVAAPPWLTRYKLALGPSNRYSIPGYFQIRILCET